MKIEKFTEKSREILNDAHSLANVAQNSEISPLYRIQKNLDIGAGTRQHPENTPFKKAQ